VFFKQILGVFATTLISASSSLAAYGQPNLPFTTTEFFRKDDKGLVYRQGFFGRNSMEYKIYSNGLFAYADWNGMCSKDAMTDVLSCTMQNTRLGLGMIYIKPEVPDFICLSHQKFPGKTAMIRFDEEKPIEADANGCVDGKSTYDALLKATKISTREYVFPNSLPIDRVGTMTGYDDSKKLMDYMRLNYGKLAFPQY
jgi:hypothetical protein